MKKVVKYIFILFTILCFNINVKAGDYSDFSGGGSTSITLGSTGGWNSSYVGLKVSVASSNGSVNKSNVEIFINSSGKSGASFYGYTDSNTNNGKMPKTKQKKDGTFSRSRTTYTISSLPSNWLDSNGNSIDLYNLLSANDYALLKSLLDYKNSDGDRVFKTISNDDYILVEPMVRIGNQYGTAFEFLNVYEGTNEDNWYDESSFIYNYTRALFGGNTNNKKGGVLYNTLSTTTTVSDVDIYNLKKWCSIEDKGNCDNKGYPDVFETYFKRNACFEGKTCGRGIGVFKYSDIEPKTTKLTVFYHKDTDEGTCNLKNKDKENCTEYKEYNYNTKYDYGLYNYTTSGGHFNWSKTGYTGTGYWETLDGDKVSQSKSFKTGKALAKAFGIDISTKDQVVDVYAEWEPNTLTIKYNVNGGSVTHKGKSRTSISDQEFKYNKNYTDGLRNANNSSAYYVTKSGYTMDTSGWHYGSKTINWSTPYKAQDLAVALGLTNGISDGSKEVTVNLNWNPVIYTFNYNKNGGTGTMGSQTVTYNTYLTLTKNSFTRTGYTFSHWNVYNTNEKKWYYEGKGWYKTSEAPLTAILKNYSNETSWFIGSSWNVKNDSSAHSFDFYAQWKSDIRVYYDSNGGTVSNPNYKKNGNYIVYKNSSNYVLDLYQTATGYNTTYNIKNANTFNLTKIGYEFKGWKISLGGYTNVNGSDAIQTKTYYLSKYGWTDIDTGYYVKSTSFLFQDLLDKLLQENKHFTTTKIGLKAMWGVPVELKKVNSSGGAVADKANFTLHTDSSCSDNSKHFDSSVSDIDVTGTIYLLPGTYYLKEIDAPEGYVIDTADNCRQLVVGDSSVTFEIPNYTQCEVDLMDFQRGLGYQYTNVKDLQTNFTQHYKTQNLETKKDLKQGLIDIYNKHKTSGQNFNGLLNFSSPSCSGIKNCYTTSTECLSSQHILNSEYQFNEDNFSCYNEIIDNDNNAGYCSTTFSLKNNLSLVDGYYSNVKAGQLIMSEVENGNVATGIMKSNCYFVNEQSKNQIEKSVKIPKLNLEKDLESTSLTTDFNADKYTMNTTNNYHYSKEQTINYILPDVYAHNSSGKTTNESGEKYGSSCTSCKNLGRGIASKFNEAETGNLNFSYTLEIGNSTIKGEKTSGLCPYRVEREVINYTTSSSAGTIEDPGELQIQFRTIDSSTPFNRTVGENWCDDETASVNCDNNNSVIDTYIKNSVNSTGIKDGVKQTPKYKITLTPTDISVIRKYNEKTQYDDYLLQCDTNGNDCSSNFLSGLISGSVYSPTDEEDRIGVLNNKLEVNQFYTVVYNSNKGIGTPKKQTKLMGKTLTLSTIIPVREGYEFQGWNTNSSGTGKSYDAGGSYSEDANLTLYANWKLINPQTGTNTGGTTESQTGTNAGSTVESQKVNVTGVSLDKRRETVYINDTTSIKLTATVSPAKATNKGVTWKSSNTNVATVNKGTVTIRNLGTTTITVTTNDGGYTAKYNLTVQKKTNNTQQTVKVTGVSLDKTSDTVYINDRKTIKLTATIKPTNATNKEVIWISDNTNVATVSNGTVTINNPGTATIKVITEDGEKTARYQLTVKEQTVKVTSVSLDKTSNTVYLDNTKTIKLTATIKPTNATNKGVTWSSSDTKVATVSNGTVTINNPGTTTIKVTTKDGGKTATYQLTVIKKVTGVSLNKTSETIDINNKTSVQLTATVSPSNATNKGVTWSSSNTNVATVSNGKITINNPGTTTITVTTKDGGYKATYQLTVKRGVTGVSLNKTSETVYINNKTSVQLTATVSPSNATNKGVTWSSSNTNVATVSDGKITINNPGTTTITVKTSDGGKTATYKLTVKKKVIIIVGASQVARMGSDEYYKISSYSSADYKYNISNGTLNYVYESGSGFGYQTGTGLTKAKNIINKYSKAKSYVKFYMFFPMPGNSIKKLTCDQIKSTNAEMKEYAKNYDASIESLKNTGYSVEAYVVSSHPVKVSQASEKYKDEVVTNENDNACKSGRRSNWKYYNFNRAMKSIISANYSKNLNYESLFIKIMNVPEKLDKRVNFSYKVTYNTTDGIHWDEATTKYYLKLMLDNASGL